MSRAVGRVLAPFLALGLAVLVVSLLGGSDVVTRGVRPEAGAAPATTRTTTIFLSQPSAGPKDAGSEGESAATTSTSTEATAGASDTSDAAPSGSTGSQAGSTDGDTTAGDAGSSTESDGQESTYTVVAGDTPYSIAQAFGVSTQDLMDLNGIDDPYDLRIGAVLRIPGK